MYSNKWSAACQERLAKNLWRERAGTAVHIAILYVKLCSVSWSPSMTCDSLCAVLPHAFVYVGFCGDAAMEPQVGGRPSPLPAATHFRQIIQCLHVYILKIRPGEQDKSPCESSHFEKCGPDHSFEFGNASQIGGNTRWTRRTNAAWHLPNGDS